MKANVKPKPGTNGSAGALRRESARSTATIDGNEAAARIAYALSEVIAIYPITPSSPMAEWADQWSSQKRPNLWGTVPLVVEMQSEGGAAGAVHGALQTGSLATTFTSSQGLLLMIPNMYKIAGELSPAVIHVAARSVATHALSIFGDHSDVMGVRPTGWAMLCSGSVQEAMDLALVAHAASLAARVPFLHFFDGFRTSHEVAKIEEIAPEHVRAMIDDELVHAHRARALSPEHPVLRGSSQNPDVYFQAREAANPWYRACPGIVQKTMDAFAALTGRRYQLFEYAGDPHAERVIVIMGSGAETVHETVERLCASGERVGVLKVRLYRPFSVDHLLRALPASASGIAVLDRTKEPGSTGEPLYQDVLTSLSEALDAPDARRFRPRLIGGRYGLSSKEFTPPMVEAVFRELVQERPRNHFTIGIQDDVTHTSLEWDRGQEIPDRRVTSCVFYGLGSDGTVGANKNSIKIIGERTRQHVQGYFVYDSKKSGAMTVSHLRFGPAPIRSAYLISSPGFVACHQHSLLERHDVLAGAAQGATFLLNCPWKPEDVWERLPARIRRHVADKGIRVHAIDANQVARAAGLGKRVNTIMQACFFALCDVLPRAEAMDAIKQAIEKTYGARGADTVRRNCEAVDRALLALHEVPLPHRPELTDETAAQMPSAAPDFVRQVTARMLAGEGDLLPVSALPADGTFPTGTAQWEKRNLASEIPAWNERACIQCGKCVLICPHAALREKVYEAAGLEPAPPGFRSAPARWREFPDRNYTLQVAPEDCTGCGLCVEICPAEEPGPPDRKALEMAFQPPLLALERASWEHFLRIPELDRRALPMRTVKDVQLLQPLFCFPGACAGCGETPYLKLLSQLFGERALIANATGCSSIYGGNLPTTPWSKNEAGRGPAWSNSLFEDNAEFGLGFRLTLDKQAEHARELLQRLAETIGPDLVSELLQADQSNEAGIQAQRERVALLKARLQKLALREARDLSSLADALVRKSIWIVGGDGWAYDIGFGGLDHVLSSEREVKVLVLDTEVYSNTGGQMSKSTPRAAVAKFAAAGKSQPKKDLGMYAITRGGVYVASVALGANDTQTLKAFLEAEAYRGPSLIIAYSHCEAHGYDLRNALTQQKKAVQSGYWPLYRYNPDVAMNGANPFVLDSKPPSLPLEEYMYGEGRFRMLKDADPQRAHELLEQARTEVLERWTRYERLSRRSE